MLTGRLGQERAKVAVADAETLDAALGDGVEDRRVVWAEKVQTAIAATGVLDALLLAEVLLANELDVDLVFRGEGLDVFVDLVTHRRGPLLEVEDSHVMNVEKAGDGAWMADIRQRTLDNHPVETADRRNDTVAMTLSE